eukprot:126669_1
MSFKVMLHYPSWIALFVCGINGLIEFTIAYVIWKYSQQLKRKVLSNIAVFCIIFYGLYCVTWVISSIYELSVASFNHNMCFLNWTAPYLFLFQQPLLYIFFIIRLFQMFQDSAYTYSKRFVKFFIIFIIILFSTAFIPATFWMISDWTSYSNAHNHNYDEIQSFTDCTKVLSKQTNTGKLFLGLTIGINFFCEFILSVIILRLYLKRLLLLSLTYNEIQLKINQKTQSQDSESGVSPRVTKKKDILTHKKNALFLSLAIKTTNIISIVVFSGYIGVLMFNGGFFGLYWRTFDHVIKCICLLMTFKFGDKIYYKICICQQCCYSLMTKCCFCCCMTSMQAKATIVLNNIKKKKRKKSIDNSTTDTGTFIPALTSASFMEFELLDATELSVEMSM